MPLGVHSFLLLFRAPTGREPGARRRMFLTTLDRMICQEENGKKEL